jgi:hypothetical protein
MFGKRTQGLKDDKEAEPLHADGIEENSLAILLNLSNHPPTPNPSQKLVPMSPDEQHFDQALYDVMIGKGPHLWEIGTPLPSIGLSLESWYELNKDSIPLQVGSMCSQATKPPPSKKPKYTNSRSSTQAPPSIRFSPNHHHIYINENQVRPSDIFLGWTSKDSDHPGNKRFRSVVNENFQDFQGYDNEHGKKTKLRNYIVDTLLEGSRFLVPCDSPPGERQDVQWYYLQTESKVRDKVRAALHDKHF